MNDHKEMTLFQVILDSVLGAAEKVAASTRNPIDDLAVKAACVTLRGLFGIDQEEV